MESKDCEIAGGAGVGKEEVADEQGLDRALGEADVGETQLPKLMDKLVLGHSDVFGVDETGSELGL